VVGRLANASLVQLQEPTGVKRDRFMKHRDGTTQNMRAKTRRKNHQRETGLNVSESIRVSMEGAEEMSLDIPSYRAIQGDS
jgi:hypothetical protein